MIDQVPEQQGLKRISVATIAIATAPNDRPSSRTTRIETVLRYPTALGSRMIDQVPEQQGLKLIVAQAIIFLAIMIDQVPEQQGLKRIATVSIVSVSIMIDQVPEQQGLKLK